MKPARLVAVVGAGPAGLAAAIAASDAGAKVELIESGDLVGGQFWRHRPEEDASNSPPKLHHHWGRFQRLRARVEQSPAIHLRTSSTVWSVEPRADSSVPTLRILTGRADTTARATESLEPDALIIATGAHDRTLPFPGWDLPGVVTGGAAQALAKGDGVAVGQRVVVAGAGPFLLPVMTSLISVGSDVLCVVESNTLSRVLRGWSRDAWRLVGAMGKARELVEYLTELLRHRVPYRFGWGVIAAHGTTRVEAVSLARLDAEWRPIPGTEHRLSCDTVCVTHGFTPRIELPVAVGAQLEEGFVRVDEDGSTSVPGVWAAGEITGIGGADLAICEGTIAGHVAAGGSLTDATLNRTRRRRQVLAAFATNLDRAHGMPQAHGWVQTCTDRTLICRCESTTLGELKAVVNHTGSASLRSTKLTTRAGLGACQGRICGRNVEATLSALAQRGESIQSEAAHPKADNDHSHGGPPARSDHRPIAVPIRLGELASHSDNTTPTTT